MKLGRPPIQDEFTDLPLSGQRKFQLRRVRDGKCSICGEEREAGLKERCLKHSVINRERMAKKKGCKATYNCTSRVLEKILL